MEAGLSLGWSEGCARFAHPVFYPVRRALALLAAQAEWPDCARLNALAADLGREPCTRNGLPVRFVPPSAADPGYELRVHASGAVATRARNWHDLFNALAWLTFPRSKACLNAIHAEAIPVQAGQRGPTRDLLTIFDEGGAIVACSDPELIDLVRSFHWQALFWGERERVLSSLRIVVFGHAVLEQALAPWPGITCKALLVPVERSLLRAPCDVLTEVLDAAAAAWFDAFAHSSSPRALAALPVFGYPGWSEGSAEAGFYADTRYFRPQAESSGAGQR